MKLPVTHEIVFSGRIVDTLRLSSDLKKTARSPGDSIRSAVCERFLLLYKPTFPVIRVTSVLSGSASTLNVVPNTCIPNAVSLDDKRFLFVFTDFKEGFSFYFDLPDLFAELSRIA